MINWTRTFSPNLINEARFGVNNIDAGSPAARIRDWATSPLAAGIANAGPGLLSLQGFAYAAALGNANIGTQQLFANTTFQLTDNMTWIKGKHMIKIGADEQRRWINVFYSGNNGRSGFIDFNGRFTAQTASSTSGIVRRSGFPAGIAGPVGPRTPKRNLGPAFLGYGHLLPGRLSHRQESDFEPRTALAIQHPLG